VNKVRVRHDLNLTSVKRERQGRDVHKQKLVAP
jgi:hypothetical protein